MNSKNDAEKLMNELLPVAEKMLNEHGEFYPYGGYMKSSGEIVHVSAKDPGTDRPKSKDLIAILHDSFRDMANNDKCKATAIVFDVVVQMPDSNRKRNAIQFCIDHLENYSVEIFLPYNLINNLVSYEESFAQEGKREISDRYNIDFSLSIRKRTRQ